MILIKMRYYYLFLLKNPIRKFLVHLVVFNKYSLQSKYYLFLKNGAKIL